MSRFLAAALVACSCTARPPSSAVTPDAAGGPPVSNDSPDAGSAPPVSNDSPPPPSDPTLLERGARTIFAVSPTGRQALISHEALPQCICCGSSLAVEVSIVTVGAGTTSLGVKAHLAWFSPDGRFIRTSEEACVGTVDHAWIARADGTGLRPLAGFGEYRFTGPWLYSVESQGVYRQRDLDDEPQLVLRMDVNSLTFAESPDGEAIADCDSDAPGSRIATECHVQSPIGAAPVRLPLSPEAIAPPSWDYLRWSPDSSWLFLYPCTIYDRASNSVWSCNSSSLSEPRRILTDDAVLAFVTRDADRFVAHVRTIATGEEVVLPPLPWLPTLRVTPDHSTVIASTTDFVPSTEHLQTLLAAPAHGGDWTTLADDVKYVAIAPFASIAIITSQSKGLVVSVAGGPVHPLAPPELTLGVFGPFFEAPGGLDKLMFFSWDAANVFHIAMGNADGSGDWRLLPPDLECQMWAGHAGICGGRGTGEIFAAPDDGSGAQRIATGITQFQWSAGKFFYVTSDGLHVTDNPKP